MNNKNMNGVRPEPPGEKKGMVPCDVKAILREHDVPCDAMNRIPFDPMCFMDACLVPPKEPKNPRPVK